MPPARRALYQIHLCVLLWAFTAILGRLVSLSAAQIVAWRLLLVCALLALVPRVWRALRGIPGPMLVRFAGIGVVVAAHWMAFYGAIKLSNASVATICLAVAPIVITLFEPLIHGARIRVLDLALGIAVVPGVVLIAGGIPDGMMRGLGLGLVAAVLGAAYMSLNKRWGGQRDALAVTTVEMIAGLAFVLALLPWLPGGGTLQRPEVRDLLLLLVLATACTILPFALSLVALREVSAFTMQLAINLEPIYAILIAAAFLGESGELSATFYLGASIVIGAVLAQGWLGARTRARAASTAAAG
jgi:drug/metabolite transporter (DMT)-like permease